MSKEIERKFLVYKEKLPPLPAPKVIKQGYILGGETTVRVRISNEKAFLTLKGKTKGLTRSEFEYAISFLDAEAILQELCIKPFIEKKRYLIEYAGHTWELDIFEGENKGLIVAEIELECENEPFEKPEWVTEEVSDDPRYRNANLIKHPYKNW